MATTMNISLTEELKAFVDSRVKARGYSSHGEYMRELVRRDEIEDAKERLRKLISEGLESAPGQPWDQLRAKLLDRAEKPE
ncbi:MAG: type II toxin-antitoxin system ParD family antitoxin [Sulfurisoma sp.]|nr:type II toxin-antitoxin system ParD family antitoxin [Sulfurisoma sp.]